MATTVGERKEREREDKEEGRGMEGLAAMEVRTVPMDGHSRRSSRRRGRKRARLVGMI
jgi:hypothetical protein